MKNRNIIAAVSAILIVLGLICMFISVKIDVIDMRNELNRLYSMIDNISYIAQTGSELK